MKYAIWAMAIFLLLILQSGFVNQLGAGPAGNLILIFCVMAAVWYPRNEALVICLIGGLMLDFSGNSTAGTMVVCLSVAALVVQLFINRFVPKNPGILILGAIVLVSTILFSASNIIFANLLHYLHLGTTIDWRYVLGKKLLIDLAANAILLYPVYLYFTLVEKIQKKINS
jgi:rod shape-determining protein MreD